MIAFNRSYEMINGTFANSEPVGYCKSCKHKGYLSKEDVDKHQCDTRNCKFLVKNENLPYWLGKNTKELKKRYDNLLVWMLDNNKISLEKYNSFKKKNSIIHMSNYVYLINKNLEREKTKVIVLQIPNIKPFFISKIKLLKGITNNIINNVLRIIIKIKKDNIRRIRRFIIGKIRLLHANFNGFKTKERSDIFNNYYKFKPIGYCTFEYHQGFVSKKNNKIKHCVEHNCPYLIKNVKEFKMDNLKEQIYSDMYVSKIKEMYERKEINDYTFTKLYIKNNPYYSKNYLSNFERVLCDMRYYMKIVKILVFNIVNKTFLGCGEQILVKTNLLNKLGRM